MIYKTNISTEIILESVQYLYNLKISIKINNLNKPNFCAIARKLGVDKRTVKKHYDGNIKKDRKPKKLPMLGTHQKN